MLCGAGCPLLTSALRSEHRGGSEPPKLRMEKKESSRARVLERALERAQLSISMYGAAARLLRGDRAAPRRLSQPRSSPLIH